MKNKTKVSMLVLLVTAALCYCGLMAVLAFDNILLFAVAGGITLLILLFCALQSARLRSFIRRVFVGKGGGVNAAQRSAMLSMSLPVLITDREQRILWYNDRFRESFLPSDALLERITTYIPDFVPQPTGANVPAGLSFASSHYSVYSGVAVQGADELTVSYFVDDTELWNTADEFRLTRPCVMLVSIDNYDECMQGLRDSDRSSVLAQADRVMEDFINTTSGVMRKLSPSSYFIIIEQQHLTPLMANKFPLLDSFKKISVSGAFLTLSIGVGVGAKTLYENHLFARQAMDMALGRGGDQAAVKQGKEFVFYGGMSREVERRSKIKARTMANAMCNIIRESSNVIITGHKMTDTDSIGSAVGLARLATGCGIPVNIAVDESETMAGNLIDLLKENGYSKIFVSPTEATLLVSPTTLLIVTDTQLESRVDAAQIVPLVKNIVIVDHHRKTVDHIKKNVLFYHDTYASSCSELVCELLQFMGDGPFRPTQHEALAMLTGIMLDTKNYTVRTGVRTFEASAYLRKLGAEPIEAKLMFSISYDIYKSRAEIVSQSKVYRGCAVSLCERLPSELRLAVPQAADDMLNIDGINASIVAYEEHGDVYVSARSLGAYNVQLIMENMGGGGHQTMAAVQLTRTSLDEVEPIIKKAIDKYLEAAEKDHSIGV